MKSSNSDVPRTDERSRMFKEQLKEEESEDVAVTAMRSNLTLSLK